MKKILIILLATTLTFSLAFAQRSNQMTKADSLLEAGKPALARKAYEHQYKTNHNPENAFNYARVLALNEQIDSAFHYLTMAVAKGDTSIFTLIDPDFYYLTKDDRWKTIENTTIQKIEAKYGKYGNLKMCRELWRMRLKDQAFYYHIRAAEKAPNQNSLIVNALWELKEKLNRENLQQLKKIVDQNGWPKISLVGGTAATTAFFIVQHADLATQTKYLPLMKEAAEKGEASWSTLALLIDRINLEKGKKQIYGSQIYKNDKGQYYVKDLVAPEYVNQRRKKVGLPPIEDYVKNWGIEWKVKQKEK